MSELVFYTNPMSRGRVVRFMLEEIGAPYRTEIVGFGPPMKGPDYLAINPMGKVPAIRHGDVTVTEVAAICTYLADAFPEAGLAPAPGTPERGPYYRWMFFMPVLEYAVTLRNLGAEVPAEQQGRVGFGSFDKVLEVLEAHLKDREWFLGERFSAVDVCLGSNLAWGMMMGPIPERPAFLAYRDRLLARPASQRAREIDDDLSKAGERATG